MTTESMVRNLSSMTTRDEAGQHFTQRYSDEVLDELESMGMIRVDRPVHDATGLPYDQSHWTVEVTEEGIDLVEANPEYHGEA